MDLQIENHVIQHYLLSKILNHSFGDAFTLSELSPTIEYDPHLNQLDPFELGVDQKYEIPEIHKRHGISKNIIDNIADSLLIKNDKGELRIKTFGEFENFLTSKNNLKNELGLLEIIFKDFTPNKNPVAWRVLFSQAMINFMLMKIWFNREVNLEILLKEFKSNELQKFKWNNDENISEKLDIMYKIGVSYLNKRFFPRLNNLKSDTSTEQYRLLIKYDK